MSWIVHPNGQVTDPQLPLGVAGNVTVPGPHVIANGVAVQAPQAGSDIALSIWAGVQAALQLLF